MQTMDNQQRSIEDDLHWLGGVFDGEGCVTATIGHTKTSKGHAHVRRFIPLVNFVNTDKKIIDRVLDILDRVGQPYHVYTRINKKHPNWKRKWELMIAGMKRCRRAVSILIPYCHSEKRVRMEKLAEWIDLRLSTPEKLPYTERDYELLNSIRQSPVSLRDYTPDVANKANEDIVHAAAKAGG